MVTVEGQYVSGIAGLVHLVQISPVTARRGAVLLVPPFAEEMNKSRRMMRLLAGELAEAGYKVILPDLYGTGDSYGHFIEANWDTWTSDLETAISATGVHQSEVAGIVGIRLGALLALDAVCKGIIGADRLIFWNPIPNGKAFLDAFLRLRSMASMMGGSDERESISDLRTLLHSEGEVEVAGYRLSADLAGRIDSMDLLDLAPRAGLPVQWLEVAQSEQTSLSYGPSKKIDQLVKLGVEIDAQAVHGPQFWTTTETTTAPALLEATRLLFS